MEPPSQARDEGDRDHLMVGVEPKEPFSDSMEVKDEGRPAVEVNLKKHQILWRIRWSPVPKYKAKPLRLPLAPNQGHQKNRLRWGLS